MIEFILSVIFSMAPEFSLPEKLEPYNEAMPVLSKVTSQWYQSKPGAFILAGKAPKTTHNERALFGKELALFPQSLLRYSEVTSIMGCGTLYSKVPYSLERIGGISLLSNRTILIDLSIPSNYLSKALQHELYHFIDHQGKHYPFDSAWVQLNETGFQYKYVYSPQPHDRCPLGFASLYATTSLMFHK